MPKTPDPVWYENRATLLALVHHLVAEGLLDRPEDVVAYFEKPWKWDDEYALWLNPPQGDSAHV